MYYIGIDIGGTNIACGIVNAQGEIVTKQSIKTEKHDYQTQVERIAELISSVISDSQIPRESIKRIGVGCPGCCNQELGVVELAVNLDWYNVPLASDLEKLTGCNVFIDNDANAAAYGEFMVGAAKGANSAVVITLGTGVGAGIIVDGKLLYGANFAGGEIGHMVIRADGVPCNCGRCGCFEAYASATGLIRTTKAAMAQNPDSEMCRIAEQNGKVSARTAWLAAKSGDSAGKQVVDEYIRDLACGLTNVINIFQPDILCIGGGVCNERDNLLFPLKKLIAEQVFSRNSAVNTEIAICQLGNDAGIIGAAMLGV